jgi:hypothetical protein
MFSAEMGYSTQRPLEHGNSLQDGKYSNRLITVSLRTESLYSVDTLWKELTLYGGSLCRS